MGRRRDDRRPRDGSRGDRGLLPRTADSGDPRLFRCCELSRKLVPASAMCARGPVRGSRRRHSGDLLHASGRSLDRPCPGRPTLEGASHTRTEGVARPCCTRSRRRGRALGGAGGFDGCPRVRATLHFAGRRRQVTATTTLGRPRRARHRSVRGARLRLGFRYRVRRRTPRRCSRRRRARRRGARLKESIPTRSLAQCRVARPRSRARSRCRPGRGRQPRPDLAGSAALPSWAPGGARLALAGILPPQSLPQLPRCRCATRAKLQEAAA